MPVGPDTYHRNSVMIVIAQGFLELCHGISLWMNRSIRYEDLWLLNLAVIRTSLPHAVIRTSSIHNAG
jgi:hypothetical protein